MYLGIVELISIVGLTWYEHLQHRVDTRSEPEQHYHITRGRKN